jgi:hypothetical protein
LEQGAWFSASDLPTLTSETEAECKKTCTSEGSPESWCGEICGCFMRELEVRYPGKEDLANSFGAAAIRKPQQVEEILAIRSGSI